MLTRDQIVEANGAGLRHRGTDTYWSYYTPTLQIAYNLGQSGRDISMAPTVHGWREGRAPDSFVSRNYAADMPEPGLSLMALDGQEPHWSAGFIQGRGRYEYSGVLSDTGSDDEPCILAFDAECWD